MTRVPAKPNRLIDPQLRPQCSYSFAANAFPLDFSPWHVCWCRLMSFDQKCDFGRTIYYTYGIFETCKETLTLRSLTSCRLLPMLDQQDDLQRRSRLIVCCPTKTWFLVKQHLTWKSYKGASALHDPACRGWSRAALDLGSGMYCSTVAREECRCWSGWMIFRWRTKAAVFTERNTKETDVCIMVHHQEIRLRCCFSVF